METYPLSCKKNIADDNSTLKRTKQNRLMLVSNYIVSGKKVKKSIKQLFQ